MSTRITATTNTAPLEMFVDYLDNFNEIVERNGRAVYEDYKPVILERLRQKPGPVKRPIQWTSRKQQQAFFASDGFGGGIPSHRSGAIVDAYDVVMVDSPGEFKIMIINTNPKSRWLKGGLSLRSNPRWQQQMHKNTGWETAAPVANNYIDAMNIEFIDRMKRDLADFGGITGSSRRAYTNR